VRETIEAYRALVGCIVYIATFARPDIAFAAHAVATFVARPGEIHMQLARRVLGYLSRTRQLAITYRRCAGSALATAYHPQPDDSKQTCDESGGPHMSVDASHGIRRSVSGWLICLAGAAIHWATRGQPMPALSSSEAELYGLSSAVCDLLGFINVLEELQVGFDGPVAILIDSRGARLLAEDAAASARTRHVHRRWYFVAYYINEKVIRLVPVKGTHNAANFLTKPVGGEAFARDRAYAMGIIFK
jgi:hypothetical protein